MSGRTDSPPSRILYICYAPPVRPKLGPARRHYHILDQLSRFYDVYLLSLGGPSDCEAFARDVPHRVQDFEFVSRGRLPTGKFAMKVWRTMTRRCDFVPALDPNLRQRCSQLVSSKSFDAVLLSSVLLRGLPLSTEVPIIGDTHNVEFDVHRRTSQSADSFLHRCYSSVQWRSTRREEEQCVKNVDLLLATSERDRRVFEKELSAPNVMVVPNGVDLNEFAPSARSLQLRSGSILFSGLMSYYPNQHAVRWFLDKVFPLILRRSSDAKVVIAGASPPQWLKKRSSSQVEITGRVEDMRPFIEQGQVVIAPLLVGGGTRVKILEAQAMGKPVVSTSLGAEGLDLKDGESVLIADQADHFANRVVDVLTDSKLSWRIAHNGRNHAVQHFDWNRIGERLSAILQERIGLISRNELSRRHSSGAG